MKTATRITRIAIFSIFILILASCEKKYPSINGVWINDTQKMFIAFIDDVAFTGGYDETDYENYRVDSLAEFSFEKDSGSIEIYNEVYQISLEEGVLTLLTQNERIEFKNNIEYEAYAPETVAGVWRGPKPWLFGFVNNKVFIVDRDGDKDYGYYDLLSENSGYFETETFGWEVDFTVNENFMTCTKDVKGEFERTKN